MARPSREHEEVIRVIRDIVEDVLEERLPTLGRVVGMDGGRVLVHLDDEDEERTVGFQRKKGQQYQTGERVVVMLTRSGDYVALGTLTDKIGKAGAGVGDDDLLQDYAPKTVTGKNPSGDVVEANVASIVSKLIGGIGTNDLIDGSVTERKLAQTYITPAVLSGVVKGTRDDSGNPIGDNAKPDALARTTVVKAQADAAAASAAEFTNKRLSGTWDAQGGDIASPKKVLREGDITVPPAASGDTVSLRWKGNTGDLQIKANSTAIANDVVYRIVFALSCLNRNAYRGKERCNTQIAQLFQKV